MMRFKTGRSWYVLLTIVFVATFVAGILPRPAPAYAATIGTCDLASATTINNCSFDSGTTFTQAGSGNNTFSFTLYCHPGRELGQTVYTITVGSKITGATGGYNGKISTFSSLCVNPNYNGSITINDPNGVGPGGGNPGTGGTGGGGNGGASNAPPSCESQGGSLAWILCGIFNTVGDMVSWMIKNIIQPFLVTAPVSTNPSSASYKIWSNFRVYGDVFLVLALLVIVFGQSIGGGIVDAYTAKKVLPRLLIAAILINLSLYIVAFLVDLTNIIGQGVGNLLTEPLRNCGPLTTAANTSCWNFSLSDKQIAGVFGVGILGLLGGGVGALTAIAALGSLPGAGAAVVALFFVMLPMILALIAVFVTLVIRKGIILILLLVSPVAFALYCLPNTEKYFKKWWDALLETLMVYPIIMAVFAVASLLSVTILQGANITPKNMADQNFFSNTASPILAVIIAFVAQFLPLFIIPFAFRLAGGLLGRVHEFSSNAGNKLKQSGWYDRNRKNSGRKWQQQHLGAKRDMFTGLSNSGVFGTRGIGRAVNNRAMRYEQQARVMGLDFQKDPHLQAIQYDGDALKAATYANHGAAVEGLMRDYGLSEERARDAASRFEGTGMGYGTASAIAAFHAAVQDGTTFNGGTRQVIDRDANGNAIQATEADIAAGNHNGNGFRTRTETFSSMQEMVETAARVGGTNASTRASLAGFANTATKQVGRNDMAPGFGTLQRLINDTATGGANTPTAEDYRMATIEAARGAANPQLANNKMPSIQNISAAMADQLEYSNQIINSPELAAAEAQRLTTRTGTHTTVEDVVAQHRQTVGEITAKVQNMEGANLYAPEALSARLHDNIYGGENRHEEGGVPNPSGYGTHQPRAAADQVIRVTQQQALPATRTEVTINERGVPVSRQVPIAPDAQGRTRYEDPVIGNIYNRDRQQPRYLDPRDPTGGGNPEH